MHRNILTLLFSVILVSMLTVTVVAARHESMFVAGSRLMEDWWFRATLLDAYCGFLTFYVWVFARESRNAVRAIWFFLIMCLGNIAMAVYMLRVLRSDSGLLPSAGVSEEMH